MRCKALILGVEVHSGNKKDGSGKYEFTSVNVVDMDSPAGKPFEMSLPKDMSAEEFHKNRHKVMDVNVSINGKYVNFESFCQKAA